MPENTYMGVDDRRDHSFKIPRPHLSETFDTPNACVQCHEDKSNEWASAALEKWHGKPKAILSSKHLLMLLNSGQGISLQQHLSIMADEQLDIMSRATAIQLLSYTTATISAADLAPYLTHDEALIRLSAATVSALLPPADRTHQLSPLLEDKYKSVRVATARSLLSGDVYLLNQKVFEKAFKEMVISYEVNSWRGEGMANKGILALEMNRKTEAEETFKKAIEIEPYFETGYINLADIYRSQQKSFQVASVLSKGIKLNPKSAALHYSYGLHFVRQKRLDKGLPLFEKSMQLMPSNPDYAYTYVLALDGAGQSQDALDKLKALVPNYQNNTQLKELGLYLSQKLNLRADYNWFMAL
jgi:tetratricopeptide (TPR) repeat protein